MTEIIYNGTTYNTANLGGEGGAGEIYNVVVTAGTGKSLPYYVAILDDGLADIANGRVTTSTSSVAVGTGSKTFVMATDVAYEAGAYVLITRTSDAVTTNMYAQVTSRSGASLVVNVISINGSGTFTDWTLQPTGPIGATGPTGSISTLADGASSTPSLAFTNYTTTGIYYDAGLVYSLNGTGRIRYSSSRAEFNVGGFDYDLTWNSGATDNAFVCDAGLNTITMAVPLTVSSIAAVTEYHDLLVEAPADGDYVWYYNAQYAHTLTDLIGECAAGTCSVDLKINGTTTASLSVSSTSSNDNTFSDATVAAGDDVTITVSSASSATNMFLQLKHTKDIV